jgi:hypothetical protein
MLLIHGFKFGAETSSTDLQKKKLGLIIGNSFGCDLVAKEGNEEKA